MRQIAALLWLTVSLTTAHAQYVVDWGKGTTSDPLDKEVRKGGVELKVMGINDFLYEYQVNVVEVSTQEVPSTSKGVTESFVTACTPQEKQSFDKASSALAQVHNDAVGKGSIPLAQTLKEWKANVESAWNLVPAKCRGKLREDSVAEVDALEKAANLKHEVSVNISTNLCKTEKIHITETLNGVPTGKSLDTSLVVECDQFTVGGGVLMTEIQNRSYVSRSNPNQAGQFLSVDGTGKMRPAIMLGLMSVNMPWKANFADVSFGLSTGPVIQTGGKSDTSSFGWFLGPSISFYHRLYLSPGIHWGEFADFPPGFTPGQQIPANFGELLPHKRWTGRFALGITIKGWDISKAIKSGEETAVTTKSPNKNTKAEGEKD